MHHYVNQNLHIVDRKLRVIPQLFMPNLPFRYPHYVQHKNFLLKMKMLIDRFLPDNT